MTLRVHQASIFRASVLECGGPPPLFHRRSFLAPDRVVGVFRGFHLPRTTRNTRTKIPSAVRRGIFVEPETKTISAPSGRHILPVRFMMSLLTELGNLLRLFYKDFTPTAFGDGYPAINGWAIITASPSPSIRP
jgi:hypothetical protein